MPVYRAKGRWRFTFNRIIEGKRYRATRLLPAAWDRATAEQWAHKEEGRLFKLAAGIDPTEPLIDQAVSLYLTEIVPQRKSRYRIALGLAALLPWYEGKSLSELPDISRRYAAAGKVSRGTAHNRLTFLKAACKYAWKHGVGSQDWSAKMTMPGIPRGREVYLKPAQLVRLWAAFDDLEARSLFRVAYYTGLRWAEELWPRQPSDIRRQGKTLWLVVGHTKGGDPAMVPIHPRVRGDLKALPFRRKPAMYWKAFDRARKAAGLDHVHPHDLRHSLSSNVISAGGTLADVAAILRHKSPASVKRYAHMYPERIKRVIFRVK